MYIRRVVVLLYRTVYSVHSIQITNVWNEEKTHARFENENKNDLTRCIYNLNK